MHRQIAYSPFLVLKLQLGNECREEIRWGLRADADESARAIESLIEQELEGSGHLVVRLGPHRVVKQASNPYPEVGAACHCLFGLNPQIFQQGTHERCSPQTSLQITERCSTIARMIERRLLAVLTQRLREVPAVVLLGPRQVGKTTLALAVSQQQDAVYLDLESERDRARLSEPELYLADYVGRLVILDEIHRMPGLFGSLRGLIDRARRAGQRAGLYLLLGSASLDMLKQSGETLAGRVSYLVLNGFDILELTDSASDAAADRLWLRGGFPDSFLAAEEAQSVRWRLDFIRTYLERDIPQFGPRIAAETLRRFWIMLAHHQSGLLNVAQLARNLGVDAKTAAAYVDLLTDLLLVRRLPSWHANVGKRLVKSPKIFVRDSGVVHALLSIVDKETLLSHPVVGASWEGFVVENLLAAAPEGVQGYFYRTSGGAEIDLLLHFPDGRLWAIEVKRSLTPRAERGFHSACADLTPARRFIVYPGTETYPLSPDVQVTPLRDLAHQLVQKPQ